MPIKKLDGRKFFAAFKNGAGEVARKKEQLNDINLFPVADNDTGTNITFTLNSTVLRVKPRISIYETMNEIARTAISVSRGNSGLIFAQFFSGLAEKMEAVRDLDTRDFAGLVRQTVPYLYASIDDPREGTILTVIKDWSEELESLVLRVDDFASLFKISLETARSSLEETRNRLEVLRQNNTVDAGAQGFIYFLEGMLDYWIKGSQPSPVIQETAAAKPEVEKLPHQQDLDYRYCTEVLLMTDNSFPDIKRELSDLGNSLISASAGDRLRIHLHTDEPGKMVALLRDRGQIIEQKVDDMQRQSEVVYDSHPPIALVTDSVADLPRRLIDRYQIHIIPLNLIIDGVNYLDKLTINPEYFERYLEHASDFPSSSQPTADYIFRYLEQIAPHYQSIMVISVSEALSGTGQSFHRALKQLEQERDMEISYIDSRLNSGAQGLLVLKAAEAIEKGHTRREIESIIRDYRGHSHIFVNVEDLEYMVRGGRISSVKGRLASLLNLKPIISLDKEGKGIIMDKAFSRRGVTRKLLKKIKQLKHEGHLEKYAIVHARAPGLAEEYREQMVEAVGFEPEYVEEISSVTALNAGRGAVAVSTLGK